MLVVGIKILLSERLLDQVTVKSSNFDGYVYKPFKGSLLKNKYLTTENTKRNKSMSSKCYEMNTQIFALGYKAKQLNFKALINVNIPPSKGSKVDKDRVMSNKSTIPLQVGHV